MEDKTVICKTGINLEKLGGIRKEEGLLIPNEVLKGQNNANIYFDVKVGKPDKFGNPIAITLPQTKEQVEAKETRKYINTGGGMIVYTTSMDFFLTKKPR